MKMATLKHFLFMSCLALLTDATYGGAQIYIRRQPESSRNISVNVGGSLNGSICIDCQNQIQAQETDQEPIDKDEPQVKLDKIGDLKNLSSNLIENEMRITDVNTTTTKGKSTVKPELPNLKTTKAPELPNLGTTVEVDLPFVEITKEPLKKPENLTKDTGLSVIKLRIIPQAFKAKLSKASEVRVTPKAEAPAASEAPATSAASEAPIAPKGPTALEAPSNLADPEEPAAVKPLATLADPEEPAALKAPATLADPEEPAALKAPATLADPEEPAALKAPGTLADPEEPAASKLALVS